MPGACLLLVRQHLLVLNSEPCRHGSTVNAVAYGSYEPSLQKEARSQRRTAKVAAFGMSSAGPVGDTADNPDPTTLHKVF